MIQCSRLVCYQGERQKIEKAEADGADAATRVSEDTEAVTRGRPPPVLEYLVSLTQLVSCYRDRICELLSILDASAAKHLGFRAVIKSAVGAASPGRCASSRLDHGLKTLRGGCASSRLGHSHPKIDQN